MKNIAIENFLHIYTDLENNENTPLFIHSLDVAKTCVAIADILKIDYDKNYYFLSGLLHDIGLFIQNLSNNLIEDHSLKYNISKTALYSFDMLSLLEQIDKKSLHSLVSTNIIQYLDLNFPKLYLNVVRKSHKNFLGIFFESEKEKLLTEVLYIADQISIFYRRNIKKGLGITADLIKKHVMGLEISKEVLNSSLIFLEDIFLMNLCFDQNFHNNFFDKNSIFLNKFNMIKFSKLFSFFIDYRSSYTRNHTTYVAELSKLLGKELGDEENSDIMYLAGIYHDIGKIKTPLSILHKKGKLTSEEFFVMKNHIIDTYKFFEKSPELDFFGKYSYSHHERLDGSGYPFGKKENELDLNHRIIALVDVYSALIEDRPYRKALDKKEALKVIEKEVENKKLDFVVYNKLKELIKNGLNLNRSENIINYFFDIVLD
jgi:putative nucleotidyltransferase with HDIG domain